MRHALIYRALKRFGFSPAKAGEILLDAQRGCNYARRVIHLAACDYRITGRNRFPEGR